MKQVRHLGVYGLIIKDGKIALVLKARGAYTGKLDLPGGSIEHGETPIETLKRELKEELNADVKKATLFDTDSVIAKWSYDNNEEEMHHIGIFYKVVLENDSLKTDSDELDSLGANWYDINSLKENNVSPLTWIELKKFKYK